MANIIEMNNFIQQKLKELNKSEIGAVELARLLDEAGVLNDNKDRPGLPLRQYLRATKIKGGFQYPNKRWVVKREEAEQLFSIKEAADKLDLSEQALYKKIERKKVKVEHIEGRIAIPASELGISDEAQQDSVGNLFIELNNIKMELTNLVYRLDSLIHKQNTSTKSSGGSMLTLHQEIASILAEKGKPLTTKQIAELVNQRGNYKKKDGSPVTDFQIHGRTKNYPQLFMREGSLVKLLDHKN